MGPRPRLRRAEARRRWRTRRRRPRPLAGKRAPRPLARRALCRPTRTGAAARARSGSRRTTSARGAAATTPTRSSTRRRTRRLAPQRAPAQRRGRGSTMRRTTEPRRGRSAKWPTRPAGPWREANAVRAPQDVEVEALAALRAFSKSATLLCPVGVPMPPPPRAARPSPRLPVARLLLGAGLSALSGAAYAAFTYPRLREPFAAIALGLFLFWLRHAYFRLPGVAGVPFSRSARVFVRSRHSPVTTKQS